MLRITALFILHAMVPCAVAGSFATLWQLGADDGGQAPFSQESFDSNASPGSAFVKDDDYYFAGPYPAPVGQLVASEVIENFEWAVTSGDPQKRIHFPLNVVQASPGSLLRLSVDLINGGAWVNRSLPGFAEHNISITFNGKPLGMGNRIVWNKTLVFTIPAASVSAVPGANVLQIQRTGGSVGGYVGFDFIRLEADTDALIDSDEDGMARWFEETYGLNDAAAVDAMQDPDGDQSDNLAEFRANTNPTDADSDNDGLTDSREAALGTDPLSRDTDGDGLTDDAEKSSSPLLADTDGDLHPDNIELEKGSNPLSAVSVPFDFPGAISLQFVCERLESARLASGEPAGLFRLPHWNSSDPLPSWAPDGMILNASKTALKDHRGQITSAAASWSYPFSGEGFHRGTGDAQLFSGLLGSERKGTINSNNEITTAINTASSINLTGIPFASYDLIVYAGHAYPGSRSIISRQGDLAGGRYLMCASEPPFRGFKEAVSNVTPQLGNYVRFRNLSGSAQTIMLHSQAPLPPAPGEQGQLVTERYLIRAGIHGIQIIDSVKDTDGDGMVDAMEIENRFNPAVPDAMADADGDSMKNAVEIASGTDPHHADSDRDGILDGAESGPGTSPLDADSDNDGLTDGDEVNASPFPSSPVLVDSDGDGFTDAAERTYGSNPLLANSTPPPVPVWNAANRTWLWRIDNLRLLWNHEQSMLGAIRSDETMLFEAVADINQSGWLRQIGIGIRYVNGRLVHQFRSIEGVFHRSGYPGQGFWDSDWDVSVTDRTRAFGLSGYGPADDSAPLRLEFTATQPDLGQNLWTLRFQIQDLTIPSSPVLLASFSNSSAVAADPSLLTGTTIWKNQSGAVGRVSLWTETGVRALISAAPLGPVDSDSDGIPSSWETTHSFNPTNPADAALDADSDGLSNLREFLAGTQPRAKDSDSDGVSDGVEVHNGTNPLSSTSIPAWFHFSGKIDDLDGDGLSDSWLLWSGGKPRAPHADDDGDGVNNLSESRAGTDPDDSTSRMKLSAWPSGDDFVLTWTNLPDKVHHLESSTSLNQWASLPGVSSVSGGYRQMVLSDVFPSMENRFYRAGVGPVDSDNDGVEDWVEKNVLGSSPSDAASTGQPLVRSNGQPLGGDALTLIGRLQGSSPAGGTVGSSVPGLPSPVSASRFLMQASFGPTLDAIDEVRELGYAGWIDRQIALPVSLHQPYIKEIKADSAGPRSDRTYNFNEPDHLIHGNNVTTPFARNAIASEDQLRQRVAFALSQILVVSRRNADLEEKAEAITNYYDVLVRNALGNYGDLLREVTFHPSMGMYLSHAGNQKGDPSIPRYPDENYAREIMQLFTIGIWELNPDGSRKLDGNGEPIPTYDNGDVTEMARVFTGLYYVSPYGWGSGGWADEHFTQPMVMHPDRHDFGSKLLPNGVVIPEREPSEENGNQDVRDAVEALFLHPNTAPFVSRQLIQFLVTDNPSPGYIRRVRDVFVNDGSGGRGNLAAVVKAILLDTEARNPPLSLKYGKVREPVIRTMHLGRLLHLAEAHPKFVWWNWTDNFYSSSIQEPMNSPSVFNFYTPFYQAPGEIRNAGLVSPGFQIVNTYSAVSFPNLLWDYLHDGFKSGWQWKFPMDFSTPLLLADHPAALVDHVNLLVCSGTMTVRTRAILLAALADPALGRKDRVALAIWTAMSCPEGIIQK